MQNLLKETIEVIKEHGHETKDVLWVGNHEVKSTWENFVRIADIEYHDDLAPIYIPIDLMVVGKDWWLERCTEDNVFEWWEYKEYPKEPVEKVTFLTLISDDADYGLTKNKYYEN